MPQFGDPTRSRHEGRQNLHEEAMRVMAGRTNRVYENHEFEVPVGAVNFSLKDDLDHVNDCSCGRSAFSVVEFARISDMYNLGPAGLTIRLNETTCDPFTVFDGEYLAEDRVEVSDILFTNPGASAVDVRIKLT